MDSVLEIRETLKNISKKMQVIENKKADFINNKKWQELKQKQEEYYIKLAEKQLEFFKNYNKSSPKKFKQDKIDFYTNYINNNINKEK